MEPLFDENFWMLAKRRYDSEGDFIRATIVEELEEKLKDHNREFSKRAVISYRAEDAERLGGDWIMSAAELTFPQSDYDAIFHIGALDHSNDPVGQMVQSRLALKADGIFLAGFLGGESLTTLRRFALEADILVHGGASPRVAPMIDLRDGTNLLARAGYALPVGDHLVQKAQYRDLAHLLQDLRKLGLTNPLAARRKKFTKRQFFEELERVYSRNMPEQSGNIFVEIEWIFLTGYAPSSTQPQPLKPGAITKPFGL